MINRVVKGDITYLDKPESYRKCYRCRNRNRQSRHWRRPGCHSSEIVTWCPLHTSRCRSPRKPRNPSCRQLKDDIKCGNCQLSAYLGRREERQNKQTNKNRTTKEKNRQKKKRRKRKKKKKKKTKKEEEKRRRIYYILFYLISVVVDCLHRI